MNDREIENYELKQLLSRARAFAKRRGYPHAADDFAQEVAVKLLTGGGVHLKHSFIDFLRREYGDTRSPVGRRRSRERHFPISLDAPVGDESEGCAGTLLHEHLASPEREPAPVGSAWRSHACLSGVDAAIAELRFDHDWSQEEVANFLGVTPSRISQISRRVEGAITSAAVLSEALDVYRDDPGASLLEIDWIRF